MFSALKTFEQNRLIAFIPNRMNQSIFLMPSVYTQHKIDSNGLNSCSKCLIEEQKNK